MAVNPADIPDLTDTELLKSQRYCLYTGAFGQTRSFNGKSVTFGTPETVMKLIALLEQRIAAASTIDPGVAYARFDDPT